MTTYKLYPWPFKTGEVSTLFWINSPYTEVTGTKMVQVYFKTSLEMRHFDLPWGTLPLLKLGYRYVNGHILDEAPNLTSGCLKMNQIEEVNIKKAYTALYNKLYSFTDANAAICGYEKCTTFQVSGRKFVIPCVELARALFANKSFFANRLITTAGLEELTVNEEIDNDYIHIDFSRDYPKELLRNQFIEEYIWLKYTPELYECWKSVFSNLVSEKQIIVKLPLLKDAIIKYKGLSSGACTLILNMNISNLHFPFKCYSYTHPDLTDSNGDALSKRNRYVGSDIPEDIPLDGDTVSTKKNSTVLIFDSEPSRHFVNPPRKIPSACPYPSLSVAKKVYVEGTENQLFSMQDKTGKGKAHSVDILNTVDITPVQIDNDFIEFCKALNCIKRIKTISSLEISYENIAGESNFAIMENGQRRRLAIVTITLPSGYTLSIIEACQIDKWSLCTLTILSRDYKKETILNMTDKLKKAGGHWRNSWFITTSAEQYKPIKHFNRTPERWANLMLGILPFYLR